MRCLASPPARPTCSGWYPQAVVLLALQVAVAVLGSGDVVARIEQAQNLTGPDRRRPTVASIVLVPDWAA
jgi:hypothetical protein